MRRAGRRAANVVVINRGARQRPARVEVMSSWGTYNLIRVCSGELPDWLSESKDAFTPFRVGRRLYVVDIDEIGEAELRGEIVIVEGQGRPIRGAA